MVGQHFQVGVGKLVVPHECGQEVDHRRRRSISQDGNASTSVLEFGPYLRVGHLTGLHDHNGVVDAGRCLTTHGATLLGMVVLTLWTAIRQQLNQIGVVDHGVVKQKFLLRQGEPLVTAYSPVVLCKPRLEGRVVGCKQGF